MKGTKPDFHEAMNGEAARPLYEYFLSELAKNFGQDNKVFPGAFGEHMKIDMECDGPVTLVIESKKDPKLQLKWEKAQQKKAALENTGKEEEPVPE